MLKKIIIVLLVASILNVIVFAGDKSPLFKIGKQNGGIVPCLLGVFDPRMGYLANQGNVDVSLEDALSLAVFVPILGQFAWVIIHCYYAYTGYQAGKDVSSACIGSLGWKTANMMGRTKGRMVEWLGFIPLINLYSLFVYITETTGGKTWDQIVAKENIGR